jgi:hypothetical protein
MSEGASMCMVRGKDLTPRTGLTRWVFDTGVDSKISTSST